MNTIAKQHPIQLEEVLVKELSIKLKKPTTEEDFRIPIRVHTGHSSFDEKENAISVGLLAINDPEKKAEIDMHVEIMGIFIVSPEFPLEHINDWAQKNAPYLLYPFLREQVYGLTVRAGIPPVILPLIEVPRRKKEQ